MNDIIKAMIERRSCKKFKKDSVPAEVIDQIIQAGLYAASGRGKQDAIIVAVTNPEMRDKLAKINHQIGGFPPGLDPFYGAPAVLVVLAEKNCSTHVYDGSLVMGNLMLAAHSLGIGSCWIHRAKEEFELPEFQDWLKSLGIEGEYEGIGHCVLGYADTQLPAPPARKEPRVFYVK